MAKLVLRNEGGPERAAKDEDIEPAGMIGDEERVPPWAMPRDRRPNADYPRRRCEEPSWPRRTTEDQLGDDVNRGDKREKQDDPGYSQGSTSVEANSLTGSD